MKGDHNRRFSPALDEKATEGYRHYHESTLQQHYHDDSNLPTPWSLFRRVIKLHDRQEPRGSAGLFFTPSLP